MFGISNSWKSTGYHNMSAKVLSPWMYTKILSCSPVNELSIVWPFRFAMARQEPDHLYMSCAATDLDCTHILHVVWGFFSHHLTGKGSTGSVPCPRSQRAVHRCLNMCSIGNFMYAWHGMTGERLSRHVRIHAHLRKLQADRQKSHDWKTLIHTPWRGSPQCVKLSHARHAWMMWFLPG